MIPTAATSARTREADVLAAAQPWVTDQAAGCPLGDPSTRHPEARRIRSATRANTVAHTPPEYLLHKGGLYATLLLCIP